MAGKSPAQGTSGRSPRADGLPNGLCADRGEHAAHQHDSQSLGRFWCTADQSQREPGRSERARASRAALAEPNPDLKVEGSTINDATAAQPLPPAVSPTKPNPQVKVETLAHESGLGVRKPSLNISCPNSVTGHAQNDRSGLCAWCGQRVDPPVGKPRCLGSDYRTELDLAYRRSYDPDWGTDPHDK